MAFAPFVASVVLICSGLLVTACGGRAEPPARPDNPEETRIKVIVTSDAPEAPSGCRPGGVAHRLLDFADALGDANEAALQRFWSPRFVWFTVTGPGIREGGRARGEAMHSIAAASGFDIKFTEVQVKPGGTHAEMTVAGDWVADDGGVRPVLGKAEMTCDGNLYVMSLGLPSPGEHEPEAQCPRPKHGNGGDVLVACLRRS